MKRCALLLACAALGAAAANRDPAEVLKRAIVKLRESSRRIPNYACVETITRDYYAPLAPAERSCQLVLARRDHPPIDMQLHHSSTDRLRLDVAMSNKGELHSWVGASRFEDKSIDQVAGDGPLGTGAFGGFLTVLSNLETTRLTFQREVLVDGHRRLEFSFEMPQSESTYKVKVYNSWFATAYTGSFAVDPETEEVNWLQIETALLPLAAGTCKTTTTLDLAMTAIGNGTFLLAKAARQRFVVRDASEALNTIAFSDCREYRGDSSITYDTGDPAPAIAKGRPKRAPPKPVEAIPAGMPFLLELTAPIDTTTAAAGDPFTARLVSALRDWSGRSFAPRGARVEGRLLRVQAFYGAKPEVIVVFRPQSVEVSDVKVALAAKQDLSRVLRQPKTRIAILLPFPSETNAGLYRFPGERVIVKKGFASEWRTVDVGQALSLPR